MNPLTVVAPPPHPLPTSTPRSDRDYSFLEALSIGPTSENLPLSLTIGEDQPRSSPASPSTDPAVIPRKLSAFPPRPPTKQTQPTQQPGPKLAASPHLNINLNHSHKANSSSPIVDQSQPVPKPLVQASLVEAPSPTSTALIKSSPTRTRAQTAPLPTKTVLTKSSIMSQAKVQAQCLEACVKTNKAGDRIAVHLLDYLTSVKQTHLPHGLDDLSHGFLSTCQILLSLEAGLENCNRTQQFFPNDLLSELEKKFCVCQLDFQVLDNMISSVLDMERKSHGTMGKMKRGLSKLFGGVDFDKMTNTLKQTRESLRMTALMFQWSLGEEKIENSMGIGYTALSAALDKLDNKRSGAGNMRPRMVDPKSSQQYLPHSRGMDHTAMPPPLWGDRSTSLALATSFVPADTISELRTPVSEMRQWSGTSASSMYSHDRHGYDGTFDRMSTFEETLSHHTGSESAVNDALSEELATLDLGSTKVVRLKVDPVSIARWNPRSSGSSSTDIPNMKAALASAIRSRNHKLVEQLLDRGISPSTGPGLHAVNEAINVQDVEIVRLLLLFGADPDERGPDGMTALATAVEKSLLTTALTLLKHGADPTVRAGTDQDSPLNRAVRSNKLHLSHLLLMYGGDVTQLNSEGNTVLISAINKKAPIRLIDLLLSYGCDPNEKSKEGKTALFEAITSARVDIVTSLLDHGADPNLPGPKHMLWPSTYQSPCLQVLLARGADHKKCPGIMELATSINNIESVRILLKAGVNPNAKKDGVYTPLCTSIRDNRADIFELLLKNGADPNVPASEYPAFKCITHNRLHFMQPLIAAGADLHNPKGIIETAVSSNNMEALLWLLDQGLDPNQKSPKGHSPLTTAIRDGHVEMVDLLIMRGADPNKRGEDWPLCMAIHNPAILRRILSVLAEPRAFKGVVERAVAANQLESVKLLLEAGVSVEDKNGGVFSPLTTAIRENRREIVNFLLDPNGGGADVNSPGEHLPIVKALRRFQGEDTTILKQLLERGASPNRIYRGWNAMFQAVELADIDVLTLLIHRGGGVDLEVTDEMGRTVLEMAKQRDWEEGVDLLRQVRRK